MSWNCDCSIYSGFQRDAHSLRQWLFGFIPSSVEELTPESFERRVLDSEQPWLVDFYAPWCGHCIVFAPEFQIIAQVRFSVIVTWHIDDFGS